MKVNIRSNGTVHIEGYVNAVCRDSRPMIGKDGKYYVEQVEEGAFRRALGKNEVVPMHNHERAITGCSNIVMYEDNIGLFASFDTTDEVIRAKASEKELRGWSFGFSGARGYWESGGDGMPRRHISDMTLHEVSLIDDEQIPCYKGTSVSVRSEPLADAEDGGFEQDDTKELRFVECRAEYVAEGTDGDDSDETKKGTESGSGEPSISPCIEERLNNINIIVEILSL